MSGLAVIVNRTGEPVEPAIVESVRSALEHRGPDGVSVQCHRNTAMIHAKLAATPEATFERQPFRSADGMWWVADVRLDNRPELLEMLRWDRLPDETSDVELLAAAHRQWGDRLVERLVGDFAFVIVADGGALTCYRDQLGVKPLYYWCTSEWLVVASGLREIAAHPAAPRRVDLAMMGRYLSGWPDDDTATVVAGISRLPAAQAMKIDGDRVRTWRYWTPPTPGTTDRAEVREYAEEFRRLLHQSVRSRLRAPGPVGCEVSGGLDSSSVAAVAHRLVTAGDVPASEVLAYSCVFPDSPRSDERSYVEEVARALGIEWTAIESDLDRPGWVDDDVRFWTDIPLPPDGAEHVAVGRVAASQGAKVVLTGHGGDNWFDLSPVALEALLQQRRWSAAWRLAAGWSGGDVVATARLLIKRGLLPLRPAWIHRPGAVRAPWVKGAARTAARLDEHRRPGSQPRVHRDVVAQWRHETVFDGYEAMTKEILDRVAVRGGVEARHPYLDRRLVEFACRSPITAFVTAEDDRSMQRAGLRGLLPELVVDRRSKASFNEVWFRELVRHFGAAPTGGRAAQVGWVDGEAVAELWRATEDRIRSGRPGGNLFALWGVAQVDAVLGHLDVVDPETAPGVEWPTPGGTAN